MKYPYIVVRDGIWYPSGADVPEGANTHVLNQADDFSQHMTPPEDVAEVSYTKTEINRMTTAELRETAKGEGIADAEELTGGELKKLLIEHYGL